MEYFEFTQPEFLFCHIPIKDDSYNDHRIWVYHRLSLSLIEFVPISRHIISHLNEGTDFIRSLGNFSDMWRGIYVQNNCEATDNDPVNVMQRAWEYLHEYFVWEYERLKEQVQSRGN